MAPFKQKRNTALRLAVSAGCEQQHIHCTVSGFEWQVVENTLFRRYNIYNGRTGGELLVKYTRHVYTLSEIKDIVAPIARSHGLDKVYLFGSYARGDAVWKSDIDFRIDGAKIQTLFDLGGLYADLEEGLRKPIDIVVSDAVDDELYEEIKGEEVLIYE
jgi:predicted nucleotidyltransferase